MSEPVWLGCADCVSRSRANLGPCPRCGSIAVPFLGGYFNVPPAPPEAPPGPGSSSPPVPIVPWDPDAEGHIKGSTVRAVRLAAAMALAEGWSAEQLRRRPQWLDQSVPAALVRTAVRWGLIP